MTAMAPVFGIQWPVFLAHGAPDVAWPSMWGEFWRAWTTEPMVIGALLFVAWVYRRGVRRLRSEVGATRGLRRWEVACFWTGWWTLAVALVSPLHPLGQVLFSAHMTQHELLMVGAAPLLVLGRPLVAVLFALPRGDARGLSRLGRSPRARSAWRIATDPFVAWLLHAVVLWVWHVPRLFEATLRNEAVHHLQHATFFGSALLFWWALIHGRAGLRGCGAAILYLFTTMLHSGLLGALLTFSETVVYPSYANVAAGRWLNAVEDQQLGGLIMWIPAGLVYLCGALALLAGWMRHSAKVDARASVARVARAATACLLFLVLAGCTDRDARAARTATGGDIDSGRQTIKRAGCAACHTIPGIPGANANVGPSLAGIATRNYIAGVLPNEPENLVNWILDPRRHSPNTVMPDTRLSEEEARDVAAYLYTLRTH